MNNQSSDGYFNHRVDLVITSSKSYENSLNISSASIALAVVLALIFLGSIAGNFLVLFAIRKESSLHNPANFLICSLAVTDLLVSFLVMPFNAIYQVLGFWVFGEVFCQIWSAADIACCTASILHLCAIALERHQSVTNAVRYFALTKRHTVAPKIFGVWILAICISIPPVLGWRNNRKSNLETPASNVTKHCQVGHEPAYTIFATMGSFYIPLLMLLFLYGRIYRSIHIFVKRSESRSILSSLYSEDRTSLTSARSSIFSFRRKSQQSRCSVNSKSSNFANKQNSSLTKRTNWQSHQQNHKQNKTETQVLANSSSLDPKIGGGIPEKNTNTFQDPPEPDFSARNTENTKIRERKMTRPKDFRQKFLSHPIPSSSGVRARYKRAAFFCRQMAIDNDFESSLPKIGTISIHVNCSKEGKSFLCKKTSSFRNFPFASRSIERRLSESDVQELRQSSEKNCSSSQPRRRTNTAGAKVRFVEEIKPLHDARQYQTRRLTLRMQSKQNDKFFRTKAFGNTNLKDFRSENAEDRLSKNSAVKKSNCCFPNLKRNYQKVQQNSVNSEPSPFLRYSFSVRAKVKALRAREIRAIRTLGSIVGAFVVCWLPFFIVTITKPFCSCHISQTVEGVVLWLGYCNSLVNPIIYAACNRDFQNAFRKLLNFHNLGFCSRNKCQSCCNRFHE